MATPQNEAILQVARNMDRGAMFAVVLIVALLVVVKAGGCSRAETTPRTGEVLRVKSSDFITPIVVETPRAPVTNDPLAVPVIDMPPAQPVKTIVDIMNEPKPSAVPPAHHQGPLPAAQEQSTEGYESSPRRGIFRGRFRGGSTSSGSSAACMT